MTELIEFEVEYIYLSKQGERPKQNPEFVDVWAYDMAGARAEFWLNHAEGLTRDETSFVWVTGITRLPQA